MFGKEENMFNFFRKRNDNVLTAPVNGTCIDLSEVPDKVFSEKMIGEGVAFIPENDVFCAPCDGVIVMVARTAHAVGLKCGDLEILLHVGMNTVDLNGKGIKALVKKNQKVRRGMPLIKIDRDVMDENSINLISPMIITNHMDFELKYENVGDSVHSDESNVIYFKKITE